MEIADRVEQSLLNPDSAENDVRLLCMAAKEHQLAAVAVPPVWVRFAGVALANSSVALDTPIGYPMGTHTASVKGLEARLALEEGASEVTIVPNLSAYKTGYRELFKQDLSYVVKQCRLVNPNALTRVLLYLDLLSLAEQREVVRLVQESGGRSLVLATYGGGPIKPTMLRRVTEFVKPGGEIGVWGRWSNMDEVGPLLSMGISRLTTPAGVDLVLDARES